MTYNKITINGSLSNFKKDDVISMELSETFMRVDMHKVLLSLLSPDQVIKAGTFRDPTQFQLIKTEIPVLKSLVEEAIKEKNYPIINWPDLYFKVL